MWMEQGWKLQRVSTVSGMVIMKFDVNYCFVISVSVLVIPLAVHLVVFPIIHFFCILVPGWLLLPFIWLLLLVIWNQLCIHHCIVCQVRKFRCVRDWVGCVPHMLIQLSLGNLVNIDWLVAWFVHLDIPHECVVLCLLVRYLVNPLVNNSLLPLYRVYAFYFYFLGSDHWWCSYKTLFIYHSYCSFSFPRHFIHFASNSHLMY